ncbi:MAG: hypothetical protein K6U78_17555 [Anaerolineae bacterium]|nr:hypothetical protein [Anaerolineae bacterium]
MLGWARDAELDGVRAVVARRSSGDLEELQPLIFPGHKEQAVLPWDEDQSE